MADVYDSALTCPVQLAVMLYVGNCANDQGENAFPGIATIACKTRYSERTVIRKLAELEKHGWITVVKRGGGRPKEGDDRSHKTCYRVNMAKVKGCLAVTVSEKTKRVTAATKKGDSQTQKGDFHDNPPDPLIGVSVIEPSKNLFPQPPQAGAVDDSQFKFAVDQVFNALSIAEGQRRRLRVLFRDVIALEATKGALPATTALAMIAAWRRKAELSHVLLPCGFEKFFGRGIWKDERQWYGDRDKIREIQRSREAGIGSAR